MGGGEAWNGGEAWKPWEAKNKRPPGKPDGRLWYPLGDLNPCRMAENHES